jgi:rSAM/selenodomain-associated transferase 2
MPVFNEEKVLRNSLASLKLSDDEELIVVDGGSSDQTMNIAREFTDNIFSAKTGRASVMNYGVKKASGDILLFLHADCLLPENCFSMIREALKDNDVAAGAFLLRIDHKGPGFRMIESVSNLRSRITRLLYGDQGMFLRRETFKKIGGFADIPLMEDIEISGRLKKEGKIVFLKPAIRASARRWLNEGLIYTTLRDWTIAFSYTFLKVSPDKLIKYYREIR